MLPTFRGQSDWQAYPLHIVRCTQSTVHTNRRDGTVNHCNRAVLWGFPAAYVLRKWRWLDSSMSLQPTNCIRDSLQTGRILLSKKPAAVRKMDDEPFSAPDK